MTAGYGAMIFLILAAVAYQSRERAADDLEDTQDTQAAIIGQWAVDVANGYLNKIADYEADTTRSFMTTALNTPVTYTDADVFNQLKADDTDAAYSACVDGTTVIGKAYRSFISCETPSYTPIGGNPKAQAVFTRTALESAPTGYTTGFTQIKGTIVLGSEDETKPFAIQDSSDPTRHIALKAVAWANRKGTTHVVSNVLSAPQAKFSYNAAGALVISIDMTATNALVTHRDGSTPFTGNQGFGDNRATGLTGVDFTSRYNNTTYSGGSIDSSRTSAADSSQRLSINSNGALILNTNNGQKISLNDDTDIDGNVDVSGSLTVGTGNAFQVNADGSLSAANNSMSVDTNGGARFGNGNAEIGSDGVISSVNTTASTGANLNRAIQKISYVSTGGSFTQISCSNATTGLSPEYSIAPVAVKTASGQPSTGGYPQVNIVGNVVTINYKMIEEDGDIANAASGSYMQVIEWCG